MNTSESAEVVASTASYYFRKKKSNEGHRAKFEAYAKAL